MLTPQRTRPSSLSEPSLAPAIASHRDVPTVDGCGGRARRVSVCAPVGFALLVVVVGGSACSEEIVAREPLGGTCLACHEGITDVHPYFALACVDCHGGNDRVPLKPVVNIRDQDLLKLSHVLPLDPSMWWPNGIDDDDDGQVDEQGEFFDGRAFNLEDGPFADGRQAPKGQMDSEMNRDLNYLRFLNPGDLRVADATCGSRNKNAQGAMVCHAEVVYDVRRSIMADHSGVPMGALYGNAQLPKARDFGQRFAESAAGRRFDARNPRIGRVGYVLDYDATDAAFVPDFVDDKRNIVAGGGFDRDLLADNNTDPNDDKFEARAGPQFNDGTSGDGAFAPAGGLGSTRTGQKHQFFIDDLDDPRARNNRAVEVLQNIGSSGGSGIDGGRVWPDKQQHRGLQLRLARIVGEVVPALKQDRGADIKNLYDDQLITNPVDAALRNFRAYHSLNWWGPSDNFGFVDFFTSPNADDRPPADPSDVELRNNNNPFGRGRPAGCSSCHIAYDKDGRNREPIDRTVADNGRQPETDLPFGIRTDLGQRAYASRHQMLRTVSTERCGSCHGFVTRVDVQFAATYEQETDFTNLEKVNTIGDFEYLTPKGTTVRVFDNLAHYKNGRLLNDGEGLSEDLNNNGELDSALIESDRDGDGVLQPDEDFNRNGLLDDAAIDEDRNGNGKLDIPDRVRRSDSFDGRQNRIVYGGANGAVRLNDIHLERGLNCVDCHMQNDVHGDGNSYTRNWDSLQVECEDCHGTNDTPASLVFSGPNGGDSMESARYTTAFGTPWFERDGDTIIQHSRVDPKLSWIVPQLADTGDNALAAYAHRQFVESFDPRFDHGEDQCSPFNDEDLCVGAGCSWDGSACRGFERKYAHVAEPGEKGGLECYACHSSWQPNCLTCHLTVNVSKPKQEIWWGDDDVEEAFFQLFSYTRSPFYLGVAGNTEGNRIAPHRSTMQVNATIIADVPIGNQVVPLQLAESVAFSTRENLSSMVSNPYFPHTVRTVETKQCARCHTLVDEQGRIANDHMVTEATAHGTGRYQNIGDWAVVATVDGFNLLDVKKENRGLITFPGFDFDDRQNRRVEFPLDTAADPSVVTAAFDIAFVRGVSFENGSGDITDVAIVAHDAGVSVVDVFGRDLNTFSNTLGAPSFDPRAFLPPIELARIETLGAVRSVDVVDAAASQSSTFIALTDEELAVLDFRAALDFDRQTGKNGGLNVLDPDAGTGAAADDDFEFVDAGPDSAAQGTVITGTLPHGLEAPTQVILFGRFAFVTHAGGLALFQLADAAADRRRSEIDLGAPLALLANFETRRPALDAVVQGRFAYVATGEGGVEIFDVGPAVYPLREPDGSPSPLSTTPLSRTLVDDGLTADSRALAFWGSRVVVADGRNGLRVIDVSTPAEPVLELTVASLPGGGRIQNASAVVMAEVPTRTFALVADGANLHAVNLTPVVDFRTQLKAAADDPAAFRGFRLSQERWDPMTPFDPKNATRNIFTFPASAPIVAIARGLALDQLADKSGRRLRDAWPIGARALDERTIARMRSVRVAEVPGSVDTRGDGLGCVVRDGDQDATSFDATTGRCTPSNVP
jgi:hypothetical protein